MLDFGKAAEFKRNFYLNMSETKDEKNIGGSSKKLLALPEYSAVTATQAARSKKSFKNVTISIKHFQRFGIPSVARNHWNLKVHSYMTFTLIFRFLTSALSPNVSTHVVRSFNVTFFSPGTLGKRFLACFKVFAWWQSWLRDLCIASKASAFVVYNISRRD